MAMSLPDFHLAPDPLAWRRRSGELTWRIATAEDMETLKRVHLRDGGRINPSALPDLDERPVLLTLAAEDEHGQVVYGAYIEAIAHIRAIGVHKHGLNSLLGLKDMFVGFLRAAGFRMVKVNFKRHMTFTVRPLLVKEGFVEEDQQGPNFQYRLR
jgi:hypothetical protein